MDSADQISFFSVTRPPLSVAMTMGKADSTKIRAMEKWTRFH